MFPEFGDPSGGVPRSGRTGLLQMLPMWLMSQ